VFTTPGEQRRALWLQRKLSRPAKCSANRNKTREALGKVRARERRRRQDFCQKTAGQLAQKNAAVVLENLPVRTMTRRARPVADPAKPGQYLPNGGSATSGLNRAILSKGWYRFEVALKSASRYSGTQVVKVSAACTSQRSACGHVDPKSRESQAVFRCTDCLRPAEHADVNAAKNILAAGLLAVSACGDDPSLRATGNPRSRNQQKTARNYCSNPHQGWDPAESFPGGRQLANVGKPG
jgi:putative transposase